MISLNPVTVRYQFFEKIDIEDYLEWCEDQDIKPSQDHFDKWAIDYFIDNLSNDIDKDDIELIYEESKEIEWEGNEEFITYDDCVYDLTEDELLEFHSLCENDKMHLSPQYCKDNIVTMFSSTNPSISYGMIVSQEGEILEIKKSDTGFVLFDYLKNK